jgi:CheY-like chemotaxis protein
MTGVQLIWLRSLLERTGGYLVLEENDSIKAHQSARSFRPDLILINVAMAVRGGGEIAAQIRTDAELQSTPIIFLAPLVTPVETKTSVHTNGHTFVAKPIRIQELIEAIEENLTPRARVFG